KLLGGRGVSPGLLPENAECCIDGGASCDVPHKQRVGHGGRQCLCHTGPLGVLEPPCSCCRAQAALHRDIA
ncbi:unnamed protein product, partial [Bubo scandiacus]